LIQNAHSKILFCRSIPLYDTKELVAEDLQDEIPRRLNHLNLNSSKEKPAELVNEEKKLYENIDFNGQHSEVKHNPEI